MYNPQYPTERETGERARKALGSLRNDRHLQRWIPSIKDGSSIRSSLDDCVSSREARKIVFE
jgi:hypothetical protein